MKDLIKHTQLAIEFNKIGQQIKRNDADSVVEVMSKHVNHEHKDELSNFVMKNYAHAIHDDQRQELKYRLACLGYDMGEISCQVRFYTEEEQQATNKLWERSFIEWYRNQPHVIGSRID